MSELYIPGPAGNLEAVLEAADGDRNSGSAAVLCHPHPLYGGSMHDMVVGAVAGAMLSAGITTLRFNFRGVGSSQGSHDDGRGEVQDVLAVEHWLREETGSDSIILMGYSFGAAMALKAAGESACSTLILVAPPVTVMKDMQDLEPPDKNTLVLLGENDQIVDATATGQWFAAGGANTRVEILPGADHFSIGMHPGLTETLSTYLEETGPWN